MEHKKIQLIKKQKCNVFNACLKEIMLCQPTLAVTPFCKYNQQTASVHFFNSNINMLMFHVWIFRFGDQNKIFQNRICVLTTDKATVSIIIYIQQLSWQEFESL